MCYLDELPRQLCKFLEISASIAESLFPKVLNSNYLDVVDGLLREAGVPALPGINRPPESDLLTPSRPTTGLSTPTRSGGRGSSSFSTPLAFRPRQNSRSPPDHNALDDAYTKIIGRVIQASAGATLPEKGSASYTCVPSEVIRDNNVRFDQLYDVRSPARNFRVGAVGELLVSTAHYLIHEHLLM